MADGDGVALDTEVLEIVVKSVTVDTELVVRPEEVTPARVLEGALLETCGL